MNWDKFIFDKLGRNEVIKAGQTAVDIGAHHGLYTSFFSNKVTKSGKIYSFELDEKNFAALKARFINEKVKNIIFENCAVSNYDGDVDFYKADGTDSCAFSIMGRGDSKGKVKSIKLDSYFKDDEKIHFLKMDIEGAEISALKGMKNIVSNIDFMLIECHHDEDWDELRNLLLKEYEFECYNFETDEKITENSKRPYQCFCKNKNFDLPYELFIFK